MSLERLVMAVAEDDAVDGFAITASRESGVWRCGVLPPAVLDSVESCIRATRQQPGEGGALGLVNISDEFFVVIRAAGGGDDVRLLLSDATAALDWDFAADVAQRLDEDVDEDSADELWPIGDLGILEDLGLPAGELRMIVDDLDLYADEMLGLIARRLGFAEEFAQALDTLPR
jgi:putative tRNA adenosine deaminase-associated protein